MQTEHFNLKRNSVGIKTGHWQKQIQIHSGRTISSQSFKNSSNRVPRNKSMQTKITTHIEKKISERKQRCRKEWRFNKKNMLVKSFLFNYGLNSNNIA